MLLDFYFPTTNSDGSDLSDTDIEMVAQSGIDGVVLVSDEAPALNDRLGAAGLRVFQAHLVNVNEARLWVLPPSSLATEDLKLDPSLSPDDAVESLKNSGCAVLLCNPYARNLPGGNFRDYAVFVKAAHGVLSLMGTAKFEEGLLAQEFAIARNLPAAGGSGSLSANEYGRFLTLSSENSVNNDELIEVIKGGSFMAVETTNETFPNIQASDGGRPRSGGQDGRRNDRGRDPRRKSRND